jgi:uncharacterized protein YegJ (DUF2314 family)
VPSELAFEFGIYFLPTAASDPAAAVAAAATGKAGFEVAQGDAATASADGRRRVFVERVEDVAQSYAPPDGESLSYFGRGLSQQQSEALGRSREALRLRFRVPRDPKFAALRAACRLASDVARRTGGLVWDEETRQVFSPDAWDEERLDPWAEGSVPDVSRHITIHSYRNDEYLRAISLGMLKFGLPDLVVTGFAQSHDSQVGHLINLTAQAFLEGAVPDSAGELTLRLADIRDVEVRKRQQADLKSNAKAEAVLRLQAAKPDEGDPANQLLEIGFDRYPGPDVRARQEGLLAAFFGWEDEVVDAEHDAALLAASRRAREQLPAMKAIVVGGLQPRQLLMVKAPFAKPDGGNEWMWVEVVSWRGTTIRGVLANEPFEVPGLKAGQDVEVEERDVFDYLLRNPDGTHQGNETSRLIEEQQKARQKP